MPRKLTKNQQTALVNKLERYKEAAVNLSWAGAADPNDRALIEAEFKEAKSDLFYELELPL